MRVTLYQQNRHAVMLSLSFAQGICTIPKTSYSRCLYSLSVRSASTASRIVCSKMHCTAAS